MNDKQKILFLLDMIIDYGHEEEVANKASKLLKIVLKDYLSKDEDEKEE